jgi:hypothetical protein
MPGWDEADSGPEVNQFVDWVLDHGEDTDEVVDDTETWLRDIDAFITQREARIAELESESSVWQKERLEALDIANYNHDISCVTIAKSLEKLRNREASARDRAEQAEKERDEMRAAFGSAGLTWDTRVPVQLRERAEQAEAKLKAAEESVLDDLTLLRVEGWAVAVHNDYRLNGEAHTFWLFTKGDRCAKGEGNSDREALAAALIEAAKQSADETKTPGTGSGPAVTAVNVAESVTAEPDPVAELPYETADKLLEGVEYEVVECARYWSEKGTRLTATGDETLVAFRSEGILGWYRGFGGGLLRRVRRVTPNPAPAVAPRCIEGCMAAGHSAAHAMHCPVLRASPDREQELPGGHAPPNHDVLERVKRLERVAIAQAKSWPNVKAADEIEAMRADVARENKS